MTDQAPQYPPPPPPPPYSGAYASPPLPGPAAASNGMGTASLVLGICSLVFCVLGIILGPLALVLGLVARSRQRPNSRATWGIVLGSIGAALSILAYVSAIPVFLDQREEEARREQAEQQESVQNTDEPQAVGGELVLTEAGVAASGYATAHEAWAATYDAAGAWDGLYEGQDIDSPCYSLGGEVWWVSSADAATCDGESELWWEDYSGTTEREIKLFGSGGVGAAIVVDAIPSEIASAEFPAQTLDGAAEYVTATLLPESGLTEFAVSESTVAGARAIVIDVEVPGLYAYRMYVLQSPRAYDEVGGVQFFTVRVYNEEPWIYTFDDVVTRFEQTFAWK